MFKKKQNGDLALSEKNRKLSRVLSFWYEKSANSMTCILLEIGDALDDAPRIIGRHNNGREVSDDLFYVRYTYNGLNGRRLGFCASVASSDWRDDGGKKSYSYGVTLLIIPFSFLLFVFGFLIS